MRVALYIGQMDVGGAERQLALLADGLVALGHAVAVITEEGRTAAVSADLAPLVRTVPARPRLARLRALEDILATFRPDVLNAQLTSANFWGAWAARNVGVPVFIPSFLSTDPWKKWYHEAADRWVAARAAGVLANSRRVAARYASVFPRSADRIKVIYNGVDVARFSAERLAPFQATTRQGLGIAPDEAVIINVANFFPVKNHALLLEAFARAPAETHLLLAGEGPSRRELAGLAAERGVASRVHFLGQVEDVAPYLAAADVFALTSDAEGFSNALLEGMAAGLACVATDVGGNAEALEGGAGLVVPPGDAEGLTAAFTSLVRDETRRRQLAGAARAAAADRFALSRMVNETAAWYEELYAVRF